LGTDISNPTKHNKPLINDTTRALFATKCFGFDSCSSSKTYWEKNGDVAGESSRMIFFKNSNISYAVNANFRSGSVDQQPNTSISALITKLIPSLLKVTDNSLTIDKYPSLLKIPLPLSQITLSLCTNICAQMCSDCTCNYPTSLVAEILHPYPACYCLDGEGNSCMQSNPSNPPFEENPQFVPDPGPEFQDGTVEVINV